MGKRVHLTVNDLVAKFKSKSELYNLLTREGECYISPKQYSTQKYLRDVLLGKKLYVKWENISVTKVPNYILLQVSEIMRFAASNFRINIKIALMLIWILLSN